MRRGGSLLVALILIAVPVCAGPAAAAAAAGADAAHAAPKGGDDSPFAGEVHAILDLAIWTIVVFLVLLFVLSRFAWKPMLAGLQAREENIRSALAEAQAARDEAAAARLDLQKQLAAANDQVRAILDEGRRDAQQLREEEMARTMADIQAEKQRLQREIETQTNQALQRIWSQAADLATLVSAKALGKSITADGHRKLIDEALADIKASAAGANGHA